MITLLASILLSCYDANAIIKKIYNNNYFNESEKKGLLVSIVSATSPDCTLSKKIK